MAFLSAFIIGLLQTILICAIVVFIAYCIVWALQFFGIGIDANVYRWGKIIIGLICLIVIVGFLLSLLGGAAPRPLFPIRGW